MKVGTLYKAILLDRDNRTFCGSEDPVSGNVVLEFKAWDREKGATDTQELFGPLKVSITLQGSVKTEIDEDYIHRISEPEYRDVRTLFYETQVIYDGRLRVPVREKKQFPFRIFFPKRALPTPQQRQNVLAKEDWDPIPPSLHVDFAGTYGAGQSTVAYSVSAEIEVTGIEVDVATRGLSPSLKYRASLPEKDRSATTRTFEQAFSVTSEEFIPESERPHGFRAKAKALLKEVAPPTYAFHLIWTDMPDYLRPDQPISFKVRLRTNTERTTASTIPEVTIQDGSITILGFCGVRVVPRFESPKESAEMKDRNDFTVAFSTVHPGGPLTKGNDYSKTIVTQPLLYQPSSFAIERLSRYYRARVHMSLMVGGQKVQVRKEFPVSMLSPLEPRPMSDIDEMEPGPSGSTQEPEQLPAYS